MNDQEILDKVFQRIYQWCEGDVVLSVTGAWANFEARVLVRYTRWIEAQKWIEIVENLEDVINSMSQGGL